MNEQSQGQQVQLRIDESKMQSTYANTIRTSTTTDEIVIDFGMNLPVSVGEGETPAIVFGVGSRVIMNWVGAKRLVSSLQQAIDSYESHYGNIDVNPKRPVSSSA